MRAFVMQFSLKLLQLHIFSNLLVLMNFYALQYFFVFSRIFDSSYVLGCGRDFKLAD